VASRHPAWSLDAAGRVLDALDDDDRLVLPALQALQHEFGYVPDEAVPVVASFVNVSVAETHGVLSFYHELRRTPPAAVNVAVCTAEACQANGSRRLVSDIEAGVTALGTRTDEGEVEVVEVFCLGNCALGPAVLVNERLVGRVDLARLRTAIEAARTQVLA
jgi:formate dehydrogenase subunit gamma